MPSPFFYLNSVELDHMKPNAKFNEIMRKRFGHDSILSVATVSECLPYVRNVDAYYEDGCFYIVTYTLSSKMKHIALMPNVAVCGEWFTGHGIGSNLGWVCDSKNDAMMTKLREAFKAWYGLGHVDETDMNTCLLCIKLTDCVLADNGTWYKIEF